MSFVTKEDFATEVKTDRLATLYKITLGVISILTMVLLTFGTARNIEIGSNTLVSLLSALAVMALGCMLTRLFLKMDRFAVAAWAYSLGGIGAATVLILHGDSNTYEILPFVFPIVIFLLGLMMSPAHTVAAAVICAVVVIVAPTFAPAIGFLGVHQVIAIVLIILTVLLSAQVTGELYQIAEWALLNYQRERRTNDELFEKRQQLQRSLKRSEALSEKLQEINKELEVANAAAEEAKHFRGQFLANMSHELRTPLNAIIGFSETMIKFPMMYDDEPLPNAYEGDLGQIFNSGRQLLHVINDILDLAKVDAGKLDVRMQPVDIGPIVNAVSATAKGLTGSKPITLKKTLPEELPVVWADESRLRQVLLNLYSNAVKYTNEGEIELTVSIIEDEIWFSIRDTGIGIADADKEIIFEEFGQAQSEGKGRDPRAGAGLGLAIARQLLTLMGGRIWMESELGKGSVFYFALSLYKGQDKIEVNESPPEFAKLQEGEETQPNGDMSTSNSVETSTVPPQQAPEPEAK